MDFSLRRMQQFINEYGDFPYKKIHIGGTNGKGSVCNLISNILRRKHDTGLYISPHLQEVNERISINGINIKSIDLEKYEFLKKYNFTYFEALTAIALQYFRDRKVEYAIFEVGLGGRLDATNIINPVSTIITNISEEHKQYLGETVEKIAEEKAGIIKKAPIVTACKGSALTVIKNKAKQHQLKVFVIGEDVTWKRADNNIYEIYGAQKYHIKSKLEGYFQGENIAISVKVAELLNMKKNDIIKGIENTTIPGRMERIERFLLDGCHNPSAIKAFTEALQSKSYENLVIIFGVMKDKDVNEMIRLLPSATKYVSVTLKNSRSMTSQSIVKIGRKYNIEFAPANSMMEALYQTKKNTSKNDLICVVGSLYAVGEARKIILKELAVS